MNASDRPLRVALLSISPHNRAILEFFFAGAGKKIFQTVDVTQAEAVIVDFDHPGAQQEWQDMAASQPKPAIVLSVKETDAHNTVWVPKPLTSQALAKAALHIRNLIPRETAEAVSTLAEQKQDSERNIASLRALLDAQQQEKQPQPFGLSRQQVRKAPPAGNPMRKQPAPPPKPAITPPEDEQRLRTEDVYIPPPLEGEALEQADDQQGFSATLANEPDHREQARREKRWTELCGTREETVSQQNWHESPLLYTPENYLLNSLIDALKLSQQSRQYVQIRIDNGEEYILLMPDVNLAFSTLELDSERFALLCDTPLQSGRLQLHLPSTRELEQLEETVQRDAQLTYDMEALIWTTSLLTSQGRLSRNADLTQSLRLKHWPNLTRLEQFPHVMRIAALWQQQPGNLFEITRRLHIPQRYVIAFYNASHTLGLFTAEEQTPQSRNETTAPKKNRGLFARLLKRLLGGGNN
ncbi:MAG: hypothetical protein R3E95_21600 [Thiolinea sp.]